LITKVDQAKPAADAGFVPSPVPGAFDRLCLIVQPNTPRLAVMTCADAS